MLLSTTAKDALLDLLSATTQNMVTIKGADRPLGFTNNFVTFSLGRMSLAKFVPIGSIASTDSRSIIVYQTIYGRDAGLALYDEELEICFPLDVDGVIELIAPQRGETRDEQVLLKAMIEAIRSMIIT